MEPSLSRRTAGNHASSLDLTGKPGLGTGLAASLPPSSRETGSLASASRIGLAAHLAGQIIARWWALCMKNENAL